MDFFRSLVSTIRNSKTKLQKLKEEQQSKRINEIIAFEMEEGFEIVNPLGRTVALTLIKDVITRWNSTCKCLERCVLLQQPIINTCKLFKDQPPSAEQWSSAKYLV